MSYERFIDLFGGSKSALVCRRNGIPMGCHSIGGWGLLKAWVGMEDGVDKRIYIYINLGNVHQVISWRFSFIPDFSFSDSPGITAVAMQKWPSTAAQS